ncbi:hypothetical protein ASF49_19470 [Methylobacterium sp. Leaf104]|uniref:hypothetical protein n=1 Tax=Methylobacterium TaxID=407 RepID=UPI0006F8289B|nr:MULTISPECIES: hypothetical protein [Methylobacterium]KQP40873.1 hypothetical protein ASF49_19470 [Methylobacterium sp. Leaf104]MCI9880929.1 hypothetical protein [Methylobacterium goesingense]
MPNQTLADPAPRAARPRKITDTTTLQTSGRCRKAVPTLAMVARDRVAFDPMSHARRAMPLAATETGH